MVQCDVAGLVAEKVFGFQGSLAQMAVPDQALQLHNAQALGNAMLILLLVPWGLDFLFYCGERCSLSSYLRKPVLAALPWHSAL